MLFLANGTANPETKDITVLSVKFDLTTYVNKKCADARGAR